MLQTLLHNSDSGRNGETEENNRISEGFFTKEKNKSLIKESVGDNDSLVYFILNLITYVPVRKFL